MTELSHLDARGRARMVDVAGKAETERMARAEAHVIMAAETLSVIEDQAVPKGDVIAAARLAGIMAAKRTSELIPLCHPLSLTSLSVDLIPDRSLPGLRIVAEAGLRGRTGVEMEALVAASVAALTVYDMCKAIDRGMEVTAVRLLEKRGGRSGVWLRDQDEAELARRFAAANREAAKAKKAAGQDAPSGTARKAPTAALDVGEESGGKPAPKASTEEPLI